MTFKYFEKPKKFTNKSKNSVRKEHFCDISKLNLYQKYKNFFLHFMENT